MGSCLNIKCFSHGYIYDFNVNTIKYPNLYDVYKWLMVNESY